MTIESFLTIYNDMMTRNKLTDKNYFYFHVNLMRGQGLARIKVAISTIVFLTSPDGEPTDVIRFVPVGEGLSGTEFKPGCEVYLPIDQIVCISDDERADGFTAQDIIRQNQEILKAFSDKQTALLSGASAEELQNMNNENHTVSNNQSPSQPAGADDDDGDGDGTSESGNSDTSGSSGGLEKLNDGEQPADAESDEDSDSSEEEETQNPDYVEPDDDYDPEEEEFDDEEPDFTDYPDEEPDEP